MPIRKVVTRSGKKFRGRFPSRKNATMVCWESLHERDAIRLLEYSANVVSYEEQPTEETFYVKGVPHRYYPDFRVHFSNGQVLDIEVKPARKLRTPDNKEKYGRIATMYARSGRYFRILTECDYRAEPLRRNLLRVQRASKLIRRESDAALLLMRLGTARTTWTLDAAGRLLGSVDRVFALVAWQELCVDLRSEIRGQTPVWLPGENGGDHDPIQF